MNKPINEKEKLFFDLQNQNLNYVAPKGSTIYKLTSGTSLNDYYYNKKILIYHLI